MCTNAHVLGGELAAKPLVSKAGIEEVTNISAAAACAVEAEVDAEDEDEEVDDDVEEDVELEEDCATLLWNKLDITDNMLEAVAGGRGKVDCCANPASMLFVIETDNCCAIKTRKER